MPYTGSQGNTESAVIEKKKVCEKLAKCLHLKRAGDEGQWRTCLSLSRLAFDLPLYTRTHR